MNKSFKISTEITDKQVQALVVGLLEQHLGKSKADKQGNNVFMCPVCNHRKPKLAVNIQTGKYNCWTCTPPTKGSKPDSLLKKVKASSESIKQMRSYYNMKTFAKDLEEKENKSVELPKEYVDLSSCSNNLACKKAINYLKSRGLSDLDIKKYKIGFCETGKYRNRIIVPSYDVDGKLNYFVARSIMLKEKRAYDAPSVNKSEIIGFEYYINWNVPVVLCEGVFDAMAIKRNAIPLFGKTISRRLMKKLVESEVKTVYIALDKDAVKQAMDYVEQLVNYGKEVYQIDLEDKDPSVIGFKDMVKLLQKAKPVNQEDLFYKKMQMILAKI